MGKSRRFVTFVVSLKFALLVVFLAGAIGLTNYACARRERKLVIGCKPFTEQFVVAHMVAELIEAKTSIKVERKLPLGGTLVCFEALKRGGEKDGIDIYVEYTGTGLMNILKFENIKDPLEAYRVVKKEFEERFGLVWLDPLGFNNTYTLAVRKETAEKYGLETFSDLAKVSSELILGADLEFLERPDGYPGLKQVYGMNFKDAKSMNPSLRYVALANDQIQVIDAYATDGLIKKFDLKVLKDDKNFFPAYFAAPLVRADVLKRYPEVERVLKLLANAISDEEMQELNYQVDEVGREPLEVAREFLKKKGLL